MSLEGNNSTHSQGQVIYNPLLATLEFSQKFSDIIYGNMRDFYSTILQQTKEEDPFEETKKKCLPETIDHIPMDERWNIELQTAYFTTTSLTIEKRDGPSFTNQTRNNLIIDDKGILVQLLFGVNPSDPIPPWQQLMQVTVYKKWSKTVARKFERYI